MRLEAHLAVDGRGTDLHSEVPPGVAEVAGGLAEEALALLIGFPVGRLVQCFDETISNRLRRRPGTDGPTGVPGWRADERNVPRRVALHLGDEGRVLQVQGAQCGLHVLCGEACRRFNRPGVHGLTCLLVDLHDRA